MSTSVKQEVWTGELIKTLSQSETGTFLESVTDNRRYAQNNVIHLVDVGADPSVLINNTTYPIPVKAQTDSGIAISLDKLETENTKVTQDELYALSYDKIALVKEKHAAAINKTKFRKTIHAIAPQEHTARTPVLRTSGGNDGSGYKKLVIEDIVHLKRKFDSLEIPAEDRILVLCTDHMNDLLLLDQRFAGQYYHSETGQIHRQFYGFTIYDYVANPYFTTETSVTKKSFGAVVSETDKRAFIAFYAPHIFKVIGTTEMYWRDKTTNPEYRESVIGFTHRFIALPKKSEYLGAIVPDKVS